MTKGNRRHNPSPKFQLVHVDPRDHQRTPYGKPRSWKTVWEEFRKMLPEQKEVMQILDSRGKPVTV